MFIFRKISTKNSFLQLKRKVARKKDVQRQRETQEAIKVSGFTGGKDVFNAKGQRKNTIHQENDTFMMHKVHLTNQSIHVPLNGNLN